jgi:hypothetical protein
MNKFIRRSDVVLLTDITRRIHAEIGGELREAVDMVYESLSGAVAYETEFWILSCTGGLPEKFDASTGDMVCKSPADLVCTFFNSHWWDETKVKRYEEMLERSGSGGRGELEIPDRVALLSGDAEKLVQHICEHLGEHPKQEDDAHGYLDPSHPRYAPKLAAAVRAWQSVTDAGKTTPKQALIKWLTKNAAELDIQKDGKPIKAAIEECSAVANWEPVGGSPKTPSA